jgi:hypothetical protein
MLRDINRHGRRDAQRDGVAGAAVDLDDLAVLSDEDAGEEGVVLKMLISIRSICPPSPRSRSPTNRA